MKQATANLFRRIFSALQPPPNLKLSEWADKYRYLSAIASASPGKWKTSRAPYQKTIMDAITDIDVKKVIIMSGAQVGKTDAFILNAIGYYIDNDPCPIMVMQPTLGIGEAFSKDRLTPMLYDTPVLSNKVNDKSRNSGNTILQKLFAGGHVTIVGANSAVGLRSRPIRVLLADEVDGYPATAGNEGDPLLLASKRLTTFWNKKEVLASTPTNKGSSRIEVEFENSTMEFWNAPCPDCKELQPLEWGQVLFNKDDLSEIEYVCVKCKTVYSEVEWKEQYEFGEYVALHPERTARGFHLNSLASLFVEWSEIVQKFLLANEEKKKGNIEPLKSWTNTELGQTWEEEGDQLDAKVIYKRREKYNCEVPNDVVCLTAGVDTQDDRFEIEVVGWGENRQSWGIKYQKIYGEMKKKTIWEELDKVLQQTFTRADGKKMKIICTCIDSGGHYTLEVYRFCKTRYAQRIFAIKGRGGADVAYINNPTKSNREKVHLFTIGVDTGKALLYRNLAVEDDDEANYCHFPKEKNCGYNEEYFRGLTSEKMIMTYKKGRAYSKWVLKNKSYRLNEPMDLRNYAAAALEIANPVLKKEKTSTPLVQKTGRRSRSKGVS